MTTAGGDGGQPREFVESRVAQGFWGDVGNVPRGQPSPLNHPIFESYQRTVGGLVLCVQGQDIFLDVHRLIMIALI